MYNLLKSDDIDFESIFCDYNELVYLATSPRSEHQDLYTPTKISYDFISIPNLPNFDTKVPRISVISNGKLVIVSNFSSSDLDAVDAGTLVLLAFEMQKLIFFAS